MKYLLVSLGLSIFFSLPVAGQDWDFYQPLEARGAVPADFTEAYISKYEREREQVSQNERRKTRKRQDDFYRKSEYFVNEFLVSGNVIFGDTISTYCERILDLLLSDRPDLRKKLKVYTVKSPIVNASATGNGIIFVNLGLLAEVENEAQLAYILAHEIIHYEEKHVLDHYIEQERISNGEDLYKRTQQDEKLLALSTYSKSLELEADNTGFERYYKNSGYSEEASLHLMDILLYSYLPFDELQFEKSFLEKGSFTIPEDYMLEEVAEITAAADYDDSESSHPNVKTRREELSSKVSSASEGAYYQISEETFKHCQRLARYETSRLYLSRRMYPEAIYNSFLLSKKYGEDRYQRISVAKALHAASVYHNESELENTITDWEEIEGQSQQVYHLLTQLGPAELNTMAVAYAFDLYRDYPDDRAVKRLFERSLYDLVFDNDLTPTDFSKEFPDTTNAEADTILKTAPGRSSKIANIRKTKKEQLSTSSSYKMAFLNFWQDTLFTKPFNTFAERAREQGDQSDESIYTKDESDRDKYAKNEALGIDRVVCVTPMYLKLDERREDGIRFITTDERLEKYREQITGVADLVGLDLELLDYKHLPESEVGTFNDITLLKSWIDERISHGNTDVIISDSEFLQSLRDRYDTDYICYTGNLSLRVAEGNIALKLLYSMVVYPLLPFTIIDILHPDYTSFNFFFVFDLRNGNAMLAEYNYYETKDSDDYIRSIIYNHLLQIKDKPKG